MVHVGLPGTLHAQQGVAEEACPADLGDHPGPVLPGRIMPHVLGVTALEVGNPVSFFVLMEADDPSLDRRLRRFV